MPDQLEKKKRRGNGEGCIFRPAGSKNLYISYYSNGKQVSESARTSVRQVAAALLRQRLEAVKRGEKSPQMVDRLLLSELFADVLVDYETNGRSSLRDCEARIRLHLKPFFGENARAAQVSNVDAQRYILHRREQAAPDSSIANELSILRRALNLAFENRKLPSAPYIGLPAGHDKPRQGFIEPLAYRTLLSNLPSHVRPIVSLAFFTGARRGELLSLRWEQVDLRAGLIRLSGEDTKNGCSRTIPIAIEPLELLRDQRKVVDEKFPEFPFVFFREPRPNERAGGPALLSLGDFDDQWQAACVASGLGEKFEENGKQKYRGLTFHDLRRSAVRSLVRAGVPEHVAMAVSGHKTRAMFSRYDIVNEEDLATAAQRVGDHVKRIEEVASQGQVQRLLN
jgi:integrase